MDELIRREWSWSSSIRHEAGSLRPASRKPVDCRIALRERKRSFLTAAPGDAPVQLNLKSVSWDSWWGGTKVAGILAAACCRCSCSFFHCCKCGMEMGREEPCGAAERRWQVGWQVVLVPGNEFCAYQRKPCIIKRPAGRYTGIPHRQTSTLQAGDRYTQAQKTAAHHLDVYSPDR